MRKLRVFSSSRSGSGQLLSLRLPLAVWFTSSARRSLTTLTAAGGVKLGSGLTASTSTLCTELPSIRLLLLSVWVCLSLPSRATALSTHLRELGLCIASWDQRGLFLSPLSEDLCFRKTLRPYFSHRRANKPATCAAPGGTLYRCLQETKLTRYDSESINDVDVDASSQPYWATWRKRLDARQMLLLTIYRGAQQALLPGDKRCLRTARDAPSATGLRPRCGTSGLNALLLSLRGKTS